MNTDYLHCLLDNFSVFSVFSVVKNVFVIMNRLAKFIAVVVLIHPWFSRAHGQEDRLGLADLAGYRAALSGKATADDARAADPPAQVHFRDLWNRPDAFRGRHVIVEGRVLRIFRQEPVGSFPALAEVWITATSGDPFCLVSPQAGPTATPIPEPGRDVRFTGTFLKMVRYAASDGARLAPLVVGDRPPTSQPADAVLRAIGGPVPDASLDRWSWSPATWALGLSTAALAAVLLAWWHLNTPSPKPRRGTITPIAADPPLEFIEPVEEREP